MGPIWLSSTLTAYINALACSAAVFGEPSVQRYGWQDLSVGAWRGHYEFSLSAKAWPNFFALRSPTFNGGLDLGRGLRGRLLLRGLGKSNDRLKLGVDEGYLEAFGRYVSSSWKLDLSARVGKMRYLRVPYPDAIAVFDQVPGIADLEGKHITGYRDTVLNFEAAHRSGLGVHASAQGQFQERKSLALNFVQAYGFWRYEFGDGWHTEARAGALALRQEPLGRPAELGMNLFLGKRVGEFEVGVLYETKRNEPIYTGLMVQFRPGRITRAMGAVMFDFQRMPTGISVQVPVLKGRFGMAPSSKPGDELVGEVRAVRMRTLWQGGFVRNEYEHRLFSWGKVSEPGLKCVVSEEPWYLQAEALVSPNVLPSRRWERERQGPAQYAQYVTYRFYRPGNTSAGGK